MTSIADLELRYLHRKLSATDGTPTVYTASGGTSRTAISAALTDPDDYWNGSLARWDSGDNIGKWSSITDFEASTDTIIFDDDLPNAVSNGDTFTLFQGGKHSSNQRVPGMQTPALANVTGFDIAYVAHLNGEGTGTIRYYDASTSLTWQPPDGIEGVPVDISGLTLGQKVLLTSGAPISSDARSQFVQLTRNSDPLPGGDVADDLSLDLVPLSFLARVTGDEVSSGFTFYRPVSIRNTSAGTAFGLHVYAATPFPGSVPSTLSVALGTGSGALEAVSLSNWGASGFVHNTTKNDVRYFYKRSGNTAVILDPAGGLRGKTAVNWDIGDEIQSYPWFDIGLDAPGSASIFEDPANEQTAPAGVTFSCPQNVSESLPLGDLAAGGVYCIWLRFELPADARPLEGGRVDLRWRAEVSE